MGVSLWKTKMKIGNRGVPTAMAVRALRAAWRLGRHSLRICRLELIWSDSVRLSFRCYHEKEIWTHPALM